MLEQCSGSAVGLVDSVSHSNRSQSRELLLEAKVKHQLFVVVGGEDDAPVDAMSASSLRAGGRSFIVTAFIHNPEIYDQIMTTLCLPTFREGFPNVVLEAAGAGIPAVTTAAFGAVDSVVDRVSLLYGRNRVGTLSAEFYREPRNSFDGE